MSCKLFANYKWRWKQVAAAYLQQELRRDDKQAQENAQEDTTLKKFAKLEEIFRSVWQPQDDQTP
jgi:hypothetical protein